MYLHDDSKNHRTSQMLRSLQQSVGISERNGVAVSLIANFELQYNTIYRYDVQVERKSKCMKIQ